MTQPALIRQIGGKSFWCCPNCSRTVGEVVGVRLVVIVARHRLLNFPITDDLHMTCPKCGLVSVYRTARSSDTLRSK